RNPNIVYTGYQFGNYFRLNRETRNRKYIQPKHKLGENPYRFNWQTPILLSPHNQDILYLGGNKLMRSMNQGDDWEAISDDLTNGGRKGNVAYGTITTISESPFQFGLIYVGSDDGLVHVTKDVGNSWNKVSSSFPKDLWVSRVVASQHKKERVYATLNGYRWDDFKAYVYMSDDYGLNWIPIGSNIPVSPVNVIKEDSENENILYLGTDNGAYVSFNQGKSWEVFSKGLPNVAVHDIVVQPEAKHLLLGTHGRSIYQTSISPLQELDADMMSKPMHLFAISSIRYSSRWGSSWSQWLEAYEPETTIKFFSNTGGKKTITISSKGGATLNTMSVEADKGFNYVDYNLELSEKGRKALLKEDTSIDIDKADNGKYYLPKGEYSVEVDGVKTQLEIK
ncbi:MAG: glycosyl hydrolase, partial [Bacteroidota bacterium]